MDVLPGDPSPSVWREWIEMVLTLLVLAIWSMSPSVWREWIEMPLPDPA